MKNQAAEDPLNYPIKLNNRLASLLNVVEANDEGPTQQSEAANEAITTEVNAQLRTAHTLLTVDVAAFNKLVKESNIPAVTVPAPTQQQ